MSDKNQTFETIAKEKARSNDLPANTTNLTDAQRAELIESNKRKAAAAQGGGLAAAAAKNKAKKNAVSEALSKTSKKQ